MTREEMIAKGLEPAETKRNGQRRAPWHDYNLPGIYMLTLVTNQRQRVFGSIEGRSRAAKGTPDYPHLQLSTLGKEVLKEEVQKIQKFYPMVEVWKVTMMPDHIHLLVCVRKPLPEGKHLGLVVSGFKAGCTQAWWREEDEKKALGNVEGKALGRTLGNEEEGKRPVLFQHGYHDRIVRDVGMLDNLRRYMDENPFRALIRQEIPQLMQRRLHLWIHDREYAAFGNLFLLKYPEKIQVFFHRKNAEGVPTHLTPEYAQERDSLLLKAEEGAVLVTPGISKGEQGVVTAALYKGLPLIILQKEPISEYWKPSQGRFYACAAGRLLILAPWNLEGDSDYERFHTLNDFARDICMTSDTRILDYPTTST